MKTILSFLWMVLLTTSVVPVFTIAQSVGTGQPPQPYPTQTQPPSEVSYAIHDSRNELAQPAVVSPASPQPAPASSRMRQEAIPDSPLIPELDLKNEPLVAAARLLAEISGWNIVATNAAAEKTVTIYLKNVSTSNAIRSIASVAGVWYRIDEQTGVVRFLTTEEYQNDLVVLNEDKTRVFTLLHPNALSVATAIRDLYGNRVILSFNVINDDRLLGSNDIFAFSTNFSSGSNSNFSNNGNFIRNRDVNNGLNGFGLNGNSRGFGFGSDQRSNRRNGEFQRVDPLGDEELNPQQVEALAQRSEGSNQVTVEQLSEVTQREPPIYVTLNQQHNLVIVRTSDKRALNSITMLIHEIDRPTPEVLLEMRIISVNIDDAIRIGADLQYTTGPDSPTAAQQTARNPFLLNAASAAQSILGLVNTPVEGGSFVYQFLDNNIRARLELLEQHSLVETIASPIITASNNRRSSIFIGLERPLTVANTETQTVVNNQNIAQSSFTRSELRNIGFTLGILPKINADRTVTLNIAQQNSTVVENGAQIVGENNQLIPIDVVDNVAYQGTLVAQDGLTIAIGGLIQTETVDNLREVPGLSSLPLVGKAFQRVEQSQRRRELILLITPHVITTPLEGEYASRSRMQELSQNADIQCGQAFPATTRGYAR